MYIWNKSTGTVTEFLQNSHLISISSTFAGKLQKISNVFKINFFFIDRTFYILYLERNKTTIDRKNEQEEINLILQKQKSFLSLLFVFLL